MTPFTLQSLFLFSATADASLDLHRMKYHQQRLMYSLVGLDMHASDTEAAPHLIESFLTNQSINLHHVCGWFGVNCDPNGIVTSLTWSDRNEKMRLTSKYLPPTLVHIRMDRMNHNDALFTRMLPAHLKICIMTCVCMRGKVDFRSLPHNLVQMDLHQNRFTGTVHLANLPPNLRLLSLQQNIFSALFIFDETLPASLEEVNLENQIFKKCKVLTVGNSKIDKRIWV